MKKKISWFLSIVLFAITIVIIYCLPENVSLHYNRNGALDYSGSKYFCMIIPILNMLVLVCLELCTNRLQKKKDGSDKNEQEMKSNVTVLQNIFFVIEIMFNLIGYYVLYLVWNNSQRLSINNIDFYAVIVSLLGVLMIVMGNIITKSKINNMIGVRTTWSMYNEKTWRLSNFYGGILFIIGGILSIIFAIVVGSWISEMLLFILIIAITVLCILISYGVYCSVKNSEMH